MASLLGEHRVDIYSRTCDPTCEGSRCLSRTERGQLPAVYLLPQAMTSHIFPRPPLQTLGQIFRDTWAPGSGDMTVKKTRVTLSEATIVGLSPQKGPAPCVPQNHTP